MFDKHTGEDGLEEEVEDYEADGSEDVLELYDGNGEESEDEGSEDESLVLEDEEEAPESSLDELLDRRAAVATLDEEEGGEVAELFELFPLREEMSGSTPARPEPAAPSEFVCERCRLVKARAQLSDPARSLCRDCA